MTGWKRWQNALGNVIIGGVCFGLLPNLLSPLVKGRYAQFAGGALLLLLSYVLLGVIHRRAVRRAVRQSPGVPPHKALIVLASPGSRVTAAENAIKSHAAGLKFCWIIAGPGSGPSKPTSRENAEKLKDKYERQPDTRFEIVDLDDQDDPEKAFHLVQSIYHKAHAAGLTESDVIADYTGGTKSMTAGMVLACSAAPGRDAEYMKAIDETPIGTASPKSEAQALPVRVRFEG